MFSRWLTATSLERSEMLKRVLVFSFFSILLPVLPAFPQDKPDASVQSKPAAVASAPTDEEAKQAAELAKAAQNPVANMISVPIQNNTNFGIGTYTRNQDVLNLQPVI